MFSLAELETWTATLMLITLTLQLYATSILNLRHYRHDFQSQSEDITYKGLELSLGHAYTRNYQSRKKKTHFRV